jgi:hypothetical protein
VQTQIESRRIFGQQKTPGALPGVIDSTLGPDQESVSMTFIASSEI